MPAQPDLWSELAASMSADLFLLAGTLVFFAAVAHAFLCPSIARAAHVAEKKGGIKGAALHLLGEVEVVFGLWAMVLFGLMVCWPGKGWAFATRYVETGEYVATAADAPSKFVEPLFVFVIMVMAASKPVMALAAGLLGRVGRLFGGTPIAHWFVVLTLAPLLGSLITEPAAMTIGAMLLSAQFYSLKPSEPLRYATLALLFVNVSVGGALTHFAAPPIVMVAAKWGWGLKEVFAHFGIAALVSILLSNFAYLCWFRRELASLKGASEVRSAEPPMPAWVVAFHLASMVWTVLMLTEHRPVLMLGGFLVFLAFTTATSRWQPAPGLRGPALVGFFLAGLVVLGGVQGWWISPVLSRMGEGALLATATFLTAFNDNAAVTYLASQVPAFSAAGPVAEALRHAVVAGALAGGGLTVIANAPNPAGQSILAPWFPEGVSAWRLFLWALAPTALALSCFILLK
jgi:hypothetical protein